MKQTVKLTNEDKTAEVALAIGKNLRGGECIEFISDLGGGKTTFIRSLVAGAGSTDSVTSPTFTIMKQYKTPNNTIYHYDFYRLDSPGITAEELSEALRDKTAIILVEWGESVDTVLPTERVRIRLDKLPDDENARLCSIEYPDKLDYIFDGVNL